MAKIEMPSSSINSTGEPPKKQLKKVTTGNVTVKQKSEIQKLATNFLAEDLRTVRDKLWTDYILPGLKNMVCSAVSIALFGVDRAYGNTGYSQQRNNYHNCYTNVNPNNPNASQQNTYRQSYLDWENLLYDNSADPEKILTEMRGAIYEYGQVTIADFYDAAGISRDPRSYQDCNYGWRDLSQAHVKGAPGGFVIAFPKPIPLNR